MIELKDVNEENASVCIVAIGTVGCRIIEYIEGEFENFENPARLFIHSSQTKLNSMTGRVDEQFHLSQNIKDKKLELANRLSGHDIVFIVAGLGGESGTYVSPHVAEVSKNQGALTIGLFSLPFSFEGKRKRDRAGSAYNKLQQYTDTIVCLENDRFLESNIESKSLSRTSDIFRDSNIHFKSAIKGLTNLINGKGIINVDLADVKICLSDMGLSTVGVAVGQGQGRADNVISHILTSPAFQNYNVKSAKSCVVTIVSGLDLTIEEFETLGNSVKNIIGEEATVVIGTVIDIGKTDMEVTLFVAGLPSLPKSFVYDPFELEEFDVVEISKSISFEPHHASAGLSILSYFNEFIHQKYTGTQAKVHIEQLGNVVKLIIQSPSGEVEEVERSLEEFGLVVIGEVQAHEVLKNDFDIAKLEMKLEMAALELKQNDKLLAVYKSDNQELKERVLSLEESIKELQNSICSSLRTTQQQMTHYNKEIPASIIKLLEKSIDSGMNESSKQLLEDSIMDYRDNHSVINSLRELAKNTMYGVSGNTTFNYIMSILNKLP
ncbi:hypothetical protein GCM10009128_06020 [Psychrosphaera haliotis]|uniref:hypothetical protein n=1 Tax=Psychrosphaera haliotis TaxID=555083 RepID=UPI0031E218E4